MFASIGLDWSTNTLEHPRTKWQPRFPDPYLHAIEYVRDAIGRAVKSPHPSGRTLQGLRRNLRGSVIFIAPKPY